MKKNKLEIVDETVDFYSKNNRSLEGYNCKYISPEGNKCAFSRCCTDEGTEMLHKRFETKTLKRVTKEGVILDDILNDQYKGYDLEFWSEIQKLHDSNIFWSSKELSSDGLNYVKKLKEKYEHS